MKVLITGATGLIGTEILKKLAVADYDITALYRNTTVPTKNTKWMFCDMQNWDNALFKSLNGFDVLIHNGATTKIGNTPEEILEIEKTNILFSKQIFDWAIAKKIQKIIFTSTLSGIEKPLPSLIKEDSSLLPTLTYSIAKINSEKYLMNLALNHNIGYYILRIASPISADLNNMPENVIKKWIFKSIKGETIQVYGNGSRTQDFVAVSDVANAFVNCIENKIVNGIFNIASGNTISMLQLAQFITEKFKNKYEFVGIDENENDRWNISIEKANQQLNYQPLYTSESVIKKLLNSI